MTPMSAHRAQSFEVGFVRRRRAGFYGGEGGKR